MNIFRSKNSWPVVSRRQWVDDDIASEKKRIKEASEKLGEKPFTLSSLSEAARKVGNYHWVFSKDKAKLLQNFRLAHLSRTWHYRAMLNDGPHTICLPGIPCFSTGKVQTNIDVDMDNWIKGVNLAIIFRDHNAVKEYAPMPFEPFKRLGMEMEGWNEEYVNFHKKVFFEEGNEKQLVETWQRWHDLTLPHLFDAGTRRFIMETWIQPEVKLWGHLVRAEKDLFPSALKEAVKGWARYHRRDDHRSNVIGIYIPTHLNAIAALAHDRGFPIKVKSAYLIDFLWRGDFEKVEWTPV